MIIHITDDNFEEIVKSNETIIVDFWATWCGPCRMLAPILEEASQMGVVVGKVDVDECEKLADKFGIQSIPTLIVFKNGTPVKKQVGLVNLNTVLEMVK